MPGTILDAGNAIVKKKKDKVPLSLCLRSSGGYNKQMKYVIS